MKKLGLAAVFIFCGKFLFAQQAILFVSPSGSDKNSGTLTKPLQTIHEALKKVSSAKERKVNIYLRAGKYTPVQTIRISPDVLNGHELEISAYQNEKVIISGARKINPQWKIWKGNILQAFIGKGLMPDQLFSNDRLLHMARYPNFDVKERILNGTAEDALSEEKVSTWRNPAGAYIHALHSGMWGGFHYRITGKDRDGKLQTEGGWQNNRPSAMHKKYRFAENIFEELDAPDEWFYNRETGILYLYPAKGLDMKTAVFEISKLNDLIHVEGTKEKPVRSLTIKGIGFWGTNRTFMLTKEPLLRSDWTIYRGGAILIEGGKDVSILNCSFNLLGGNAVFVSNYNRNIKISGNHIYDIGGNAVAFVGNPDAVRSPLFRYQDQTELDKLDREPGPKSDNYPAECQVYDNLIHHIGTVEKQVAGVQISMSMDITVSHNSIYNVPRAGINIGDGCWGGHILEFNDVFNTVLETGDHGAFNSWGRDRYWVANTGQTDVRVTENPELPMLDVIKPVIIRNNRFYCAHGWDIDLDDGSSNYQIYNNICLKGGLKLREGYNRVVENNIILNNTFHPHVWYSKSNDVFKHNIVTSEYADISLKAWGKEVDSNFFMQKKALEGVQKKGVDKHSLYGNPQFVNSAVADYTVRPNSDALKIGFRNFPMHTFGVVSPALKKMANKPSIDPVVLLQEAKPGASSRWMGATIKNIETLGEQSASGLPDKSGVLIVKIDAESPLLKSGLRERDVIVKINRESLANIAELLTALQVSGWKSSVKATIIRDQQEKEVILLLK